MEKIFVQGCLASPFKTASYVKGERGANLLRWVLTDPAFENDRFSVFSKEVIKGLFLKRDSVLFEELFLGLQELIQELSQRLQNSEDIEEHKLAEILLGHAMSLLPFVEPESGTELVIPENEGGVWREGRFRCERVELTPNWLGSPMVALALQPVVKTSQTCPKLLFMGTPPPTVNGAFLSYWTNFIPGYSIGEGIFRFCIKKRMEEWLQSQSALVDLSGISLGGALALLTASHFPQHVRRVNAYHASGLHERALQVYEQKVAYLKHVPIFRLYSQNGDLVPKLGKRLPADWHHFHLISVKSLGRIASHNRAFSGRPVIVKMGMERQTKKVWNVLYQIISIPICCILTTVLIIKITQRSFIKFVSKVSMKFS